MWMAVTGGVAVVLGFAFSFAKVTSNAEKVTEKHREELLSRETPKEKKTEQEKE